MFLLIFVFAHFTNRQIITNFRCISPKKPSRYLYHYCHLTHRTRVLVMILKCHLRQQGCRFQIPLLRINSISRNNTHNALQFHQACTSNPIKKRKWDITIKTIKLRARQEFRMTLCVCDCFALFIKIIELTRRFNISFLSSRSIGVNCFRL